MTEQRVLSQLIYELPVVQVTGSANVLIASIEFDSRKITPGALFVATSGTATNGHQYIDTAIQAGAVAVVCEQLPSQLNPEVCYVKVTNSAIALGYLASAWYDFPSSKLTLVGVTGTNGKTTIATLLYELFRAMGHKTGLLSTVVNYIDTQAVEATHTTPDALSINRLMAEMVEAGCSYAFMEVSSHAVEQGRIAGLEFDGGIFTNLTRDHLDYHLTFENYLKAKKGFFDALPATAFALTNVDDKNGLVMLQNTAARKCTYSLRTMADFNTRILEHGFEGMLLDMNDKEVNVSFIGRFNAANLTAVYGAAMLLGADELEVLRVMSSLNSVSGRFETLRAPSGYTAIVDYAHTPDALVNVITTINQILQGSGRLITVVGCGGNRDKGKRPIMAREAVEGSWKAVLTSDNPRFENPQEILNDMLAGLDPVQKSKSITIVDRREAIKTACALAQPGDVVLVAGKGHEDYQIIQGVKHHFDDREEVKKCFV
ncbi:MAG: UDP-N-acetylmuramoyl-L-alanyl-D-glutamate--2,6-diaminopimelate ligase [Paludibacter sp.]|jgi:UDP-N-acetylmuramoyl-L-alanyl-D-glutamate--2,6-diaminopimelate ligase|nr:UDP-N-acetylmuramoyl-L-alanyl-D-glutamate--2,6-diaminopimelate ligase [Paludibacter sp.]